MSDQTEKKWALCLGHCGVVDQATLVPCDFDPLGLCPTCNEQACDCPSCIGQALVELTGDYDAMQQAISFLKASQSHE